MQAPNNTLPAANQNPQATAPPPRPQRPAGQFLKHVSSGRVHGTIWRRPLGNNERSSTIYDISICRKYCDNQGQWRESHCFDLQDLLALRAVISIVLHYLRKRP
jgi:hypothetical protein